MPAIRPPETFPVASDGRASAVVAAHLGLPESRVRELIAFGSVYWNYQRLADDIAVRAGDWLRVHPEPRRFPAGGFDWASRIVAERAEYVVIDKPGGVPMHPTCDNAVENALTQVERVLGRKLHVCHRLDAATSGLVVLAKTPAFCAEFGRWLERRAIGKHYEAWVAEPVGEGEQVHYQLPGPRAPKVAVREKVAGAKECRLTIEAKHPEGDAWRLSIALGTGRMHQIRSQLAALGAPILGDVLYGSDRPAPPGFGTGDVIALRCVRLELPGAAFALAR